MTDELTTQELLLVVQHGSGGIERSLALIELAKRRDRLDELLALAEDA